MSKTAMTEKIGFRLIMIVFLLLESLESSKET